MDLKRLKLNVRLEIILLITIQYEYFKTNILESKFSENKELLFYTPTDFTDLNFLTKFLKQKILTNQEDFTITAAQITENLYSKNIFGYIDLQNSVKEIFLKRFQNFWVLKLF